jgi:hypothetical protein
MTAVDSVTLSNAFMHGKIDLIMDTFHNFPGILPSIENLTSLPEKSIQMLKKFYPTVYQQAVHKLFLKNLQIRQTFYMSPTPMGIEELRKNQNTLTYNDQTYFFNANDEVITIGDVQFKVIERGYKASFEFHTSKYCFDESYVIDTPLFNSTVIYANCRICETKIEEVETFDLKSLFVSKTILKAKPDSYDYIHSLHFFEDNKVQMIAGAGQNIYGLWSGTVEFISLNTMVIHYTTLQHKVYDNAKPIDQTITIKAWHLKKGDFTFTHYTSSAFHYEIMFDKGPCPLECFAQTTFYLKQN